MPPATPIRRLLIANRGEIAARVIRSAAEMGIRTVAVYSDADEALPYVSLADEARHLGPAPARESYLCADRLIAVARETKCDATHPGYGFLAENPSFAEACGKAGLKFVGPPGPVMRKTGNKLAARRLALKLGIPTVPGVEWEGEHPPSADELRKSVGFPLLLKAAAGGGGKGMRIVRRAADLPRALREARGEAKAAFGNESIFIERYLERPHHIEVQILGDARGNVIHLGERECSIQRHHQKLIEESPSPFIDEALRTEITSAAVRFAKAARYVNAGTVEFLVDSRRRFYLLEMNSRLQVEHPVTEMVLGLDLVRAQIEIASGRPLPWKQEELRPRGHALECRICAEDPFSDFMPSTGDIVGLHLPSGPFVRVDGGVTVGSTISVHYDSMFAKLVVWGETRAASVARARRALEEFLIVGPETTIPFHLQCLAHPEFRAGRLHTHFVGETLKLTRGDGDGAWTAALLAAALEVQQRQRSIPASNGSGGGSMWLRSARAEGVARDPA
ncbi:MAG: ATP-grasp domain-containing protein [Planctomycetes bacterium]|nr:ATP-grasp domain-containing protein [Planctomycetota bacterium]